MSWPSCASRFSQLQMLFERARAEYLVTEPVCYELQLQSVVTTNDIVARGHNLVVVAAVNYTWPPASSLHVRVFDSNGTLAVDIPEDALSGEERLDALKQTLTALKLNFAPAIEFSPPRRVARWRMGEGSRPGAGGRLAPPLDRDANRQSRQSRP